MFRFTSSPFVRMARRSHLSWAYTAAKVLFVELLYIGFICCILLRTVIFGTTIFTGVLAVAVYYVFSSNGKRRIQFTQDGTRLDVFWGSEPCIAQPVVICVTGGAWIIGKRFWFLPMARALTTLGFVVVVPDYRQYPWATAPGMVSDVVAAMDWTEHACTASDGLLFGMVDPRRVYLIGQSAGAHLAVLALQRVAERNKPSFIRGFLGVSGIYDIVGMQRHLHERGLHARVLRGIFSATNDEEFAEHCALRCLSRDREPAPTGSEPLPSPVGDCVARRVPGVPPPLSLPHYAIFLHGKQDQSAPTLESVKIAEAWRRQQHLGSWETQPLVAPTVSPSLAPSQPPPALMIQLVDGNHTSLMVEDALSAGSETPPLMGALIHLDAWNTAHRIGGPLPLPRVPASLSRWQRRICEYVSAF